MLSTHIHSGVVAHIVGNLRITEDVEMLVFYLIDEG